MRGTGSQGLMRFNVTVGSENTPGAANFARYRRSFPPRRWAPLVRAEASPVCCMCPLLPPHSGRRS